MRSAALWRRATDVVLVAHRFNIFDRPISERILPHPLKALGTILRHASCMLIERRYSAAA
jgi:hypothetical protein